MLEIYDRLDEIEDIKFISFYYTNVEHAEISIRIHMKDSSAKDAKKQFDSEEKFKKDGFEISKNQIYLKLDKLDLTLSIRKPIPLGNKTGQYYSNALQMQVSRGDTLITHTQIDERNFNTCYSVNDRVYTEFGNKVNNWIVDEHIKMKESDPGYGTYNSKLRNNKDKGKKCLYAHDFMLWLKNNQNNFK